MHQIHCSLTHDRGETLIAYLYDDIDPAARAAFEKHLATGERCRTELAALGGVRSQLACWAPPEPSFALGAASGRQPPTMSQAAAAGSRRWWRDLPAWAQVAAALLFLGVSAGIANLDVRYDQNGLTLRTGWSTATKTNEAAVVPAAQSAGTPAPWQSDLAALERQLRTEMRAVQPVTVPARTVSSDAEILRRVRALLEESERRQQNELALRVAETISGMNARRQAELKRINVSLQDLESKLGVEVLKQRASLNYLINANQRQ
jgi:anti-sigma factor RsiW